MKPANTREARLTEYIMAGMPEMEVATYNRVWEAVHAGLSSVESVGVAIVPDNDQAFMAIIMSWPVEKRQRFYRTVRAMFD